MSLNISAMKTREIFVGGCCLLFLIFSLNSEALAWGERGHFIVAKYAARTTGTWANADAEGAAVSKFFIDRELHFGHLSNVPDTEWKGSQYGKRLEKMNSGNHYVGPEELIGPPSADSGPAFEAWLEAVRNIETDYATLKAQHQGQQNPLPGIPQSSRTIEFYPDIGTTPWRAQQLFDVMREAFACAKAKQQSGQEGARPSGSYPALANPFRVAADGTGDTVDPPLPTYVCNPQLHSSSDLYAAVVAGGVLSHFVGDQSQPLHPTSDYDGWRTGNGGIHSYFESMVVQALDPSLELDIYVMASDPQFRQRVWQKMGVDLSRPQQVVRLHWHMAADAVAKKAALLELDDQFAILPGGKGYPMEWGDHARYHPERSITSAQRKAADDPLVLTQFKPLIVERLATAVVVLSKLYYEAWNLAGRPQLSAYHGVALPFPTLPSFIWPDFDTDYLAKLKQSQSNPPPAASCSGNYPREWWQPVPRSQLPTWEIPPQDAGPCEVILSKRNSLGILSNFAATPFDYRGKRYASLEGFWQMMKYPELNTPGFNDPRASISWPYSRDQVSAMVAFDAKSAGDAAAPLMQRLGITWISFEGQRIDYKGRDQNRHYQLILEATWAKVQQNPQVKAILLQTGNLILKPDHQQRPDSPPAYKYFDIYMKIRHELQQRGERR